MTKSGFFDSNSKVIKPVEMIKSKTGGTSKSLITQLWFERAEKIVKQLQYTLKLIEFFDYVSVISHRFQNEYIPSLKSKKGEQYSEAPKLVKEMRSFIEVNSVQQVDYDYFSYKNEATYSYFIVRF